MVHLRFTSEGGRVLREIEFADWFPADDEPASEPAPSFLPDPSFDYTREPAEAAEPEYEPEGMPEERDETGSLLPPPDRSLGSLRDYQYKGVIRTYEEWKKGNRTTLIVHPTGSGKTWTFSGVIAGYEAEFGRRPDGSPRRFLVLAHRDYLLNQASQTLLKMGIDSAIEKGRAKALASLFGDPNCVVASVQSMQANKSTSRLLTWDPDYFDAIIVDEGHHALSPIYRRILNHFNWTHCLLATATPDRLDGRNLGEIVDSLADEYPLDQAVDDGWVCGIEVDWVDVEVDISAVKTTGRGKARDLNEFDLAEKVKPYIEKFARGIKKVIGSKAEGGRQSILFAPSVQTSHFMSTALTSLGIPSIHMDASTKNREEILNAYREGFYQCLCNYGLFTEGFDVPGIDAVILLRATESRALYYQMVGRGLRPNDGKKLLLVDFPWVAGSHKLIKPAEIFHSKNSKYTEEAFRLAERILDVGSTNDLLDAIKQADQEIAQRERYKLEVTDGPVRLREVKYDPLNAADVAKLPKKRQVEERKVLAATFKQVAILQYNGIAGAEAMSKRRASAIIDTIKKRERAGLAPYHLVNKLVRLGVDRREARIMKAPEAERVAGDIERYGKKFDLFGGL